jgi:hypothetical protein
MNHQGDYGIHLREHNFQGEHSGVKSFFQPAHHATASSEDGLPAATSLRRG